MINLHRFGKNSYSRRLFLYYFFVFSLFSLAVLVFQYNREKQFKVEKLEEILKTNNGFVYAFMVQNNIPESHNYALLDSLTFVLDSSVRLTLIDASGIVAYDSEVGVYPDFDNHKDRPEILLSEKQGRGNAIRHSASLNLDFFYYAQFYDTFFIRTAIPYDLQTIKLLKADNYFIYFLVLSFVVISFFIIYFSKKLSNSLTKLKDFSIEAAKNNVISEPVSFPNNELGIIGHQIVSIYNNLQKTQRKLIQERDKIDKHIQISQEGLAFYSKKKTNILANNFYILYTNLIADVADVKPDDVLYLKDFAGLNEFIDQSQLSISEGDFTMLDKEIDIYKNNRFFKLRVIVFRDKSFEISINDITRFENEKRIKQQMTSNIAHELKTPVSSIQGYLETILRTKNIDEEKKAFFIERSYQQSIRLSHLISDISLLTKIEESGTLFKRDRINVGEIIKNVVDDLYLKFDENKSELNLLVSKNIWILGNKILIYSVFRNLMDNTLNYAGQNTLIVVNNYLEDDNYYYFSYSDNGKGVPEEHLQRLFERFYRVDSGRSRKIGGTGLGLAIVKNAIVFHGGEISVKNRAEGGLEFLFSFRKK